MSEEDEGKEVEVMGTVSYISINAFEGKYCSLYVYIKDKDGIEYQCAFHNKKSGYKNMIAKKILVTRGRKFVVNPCPVVVRGEVKERMSHQVIINVTDFEFVKEDDNG
jgi:hypothetical protein